MRLNAPAALRNADAIAEVLGELVRGGSVLEVASGTGQHAAVFAERFPAVTFQPSDIDPIALASIEAWRAAASLANLLSPIELDATWDRWPISGLDGLININMIHIAPWAACLGLFARAAEALEPGGFALMYGPFFAADRESAPSNVGFDRSLRASSQAWGVRTLEDVTAVAAASGFALERVVDMPANNLSVVFRRSPL